jgi:ABC-2 type transport system permease protein
MSAILHLLRSDLRRLLKTPSVPLIWLAFPIGLSLIEYGAFGSIGRSSTGLPKGSLLFVDLDKSAASSFLGGSLQREPLDDFFTVVSLDSVRQVDEQLLDNQASAALVVPKGFQDSILAGTPAILDYTSNPREYIRPKMVDAALRTFLEISNRFLHESDAALAETRRITQAEGLPSRENVLAVTGAFYDVRSHFQKLGALSGLDLAVERPAPKPGSPARSGNAVNFFAYFLPGLCLFSLLMIGQGFERRYFTARQSGILRRIAAAPLRPGTTLVAEAGGILVGVLVIGTIVLALGSLLFRIPLRQPGIVVLTLLGFSVYVVGLVKTIYSRARSKRAGEAIGSVVVLLTTLIGGGFAPVEIYSQGIRPFATASPVGCASQAMVDALVHGRAFAQAAPHVLGIWIWGIALCVLGFALSWRQHART